MKKIMVIGLMLLAVTVGAQDLRTNNRAILFTFGGLADLGVGNYDAGPATGFGAKVFNAAGTMAFRPMVMFGMSSTETDPNVEDVVAGKEGTTSFGVMIDVIKHLNKSNITPYIGAGAGYMKIKATTESAYLKGGDPDKTEATLSGMTARGILGVEWFIKKNVSLSGEYRLSFMKGTGESKGLTGGEDEWDKGNTISETDIGIGSSGLLTIAIYVN
jgi:opacity protein-like surface antigen